MMLTHITVAYFSPTGNTRRAALLLASGLAREVEELDLSLPQAPGRTFTAQDVVLFAAPVFGGRIPPYLVEKLGGLTGHKTRAVTAAVYGNRAFEDALLELNDCVQDQSFQVVASAALLAEHSISRAVAAGRPDEQDAAQLRSFAPAILQKLESGSSASVPGNRPYKEWSPSPLAPLVSESCIACGLCASGCPAQAIPADQPNTTDLAKCFLCMRCIALCPQRARAYPAEAQAMVDQRLSPLQAVRRENELFL